MQTFITAAYRTLGKTGVGLGLGLMAGLVFSILFFSAQSVRAAQSSNYQITSDSVNFVGTESAASTNYSLRDTGGEVASGGSTGVLYSISAGFRQILNLITSSSDSGGSSTSAGNGAPFASGSRAPGGNVVSFAIDTVTVAQASDALLFDIGLSRLGKVTLIWGTSPALDGGMLSSDTLRENHVFKLEHLAPNTTYYYTVKAADEQFGQVGLVNQSTKTLDVSDVINPANPNKLVAEQTSENTARISWGAPSDVDVEFVRLVRSTGFYSANPGEGVVVYEGRAAVSEDTALKSGETYYYTLFVKDVSGNFSSGAITKLRIAQSGAVVALSSGETFADVQLLSAGEVDPLFSRLTLDDFVITQNGKKVPRVQNGAIAIQGGEQFHISLDYGKVPEVLKTVAVSLIDEARPSEVFTFLLRVNADKTRFEAAVGELGRAGKFILSIAILDHKHRGLKKISGELVASAPQIDFMKWMGMHSSLWWLLGVIIAVFLYRKIRPTFSP